MARSKWSVEKEKFWRAVVDEQRQCGLSVRAFCRQKAVSEPSFYSWRKELQKRDAQRSADIGGDRRLIPVDVIDTPWQKTASHGHDVNLPLEICTPCGFTLRFVPDTAPETVSRLLDVIARRPAARSVAGVASC